MHEVIYDQDTKFSLTDQEFFEAMPVWDKNSSYYCQRLSALLPPHFRYARKPRFEVDSEMFVLQGTKGAFTRIYLRNGIYHQLISENGVQRLTAPPGLQTEEAIAQMIPQEEFFREKKYLN